MTHVIGLGCFHLNANWAPALTEHASIALASTFPAQRKAAASGEAQSTIPILWECYSKNIARDGYKYLCDDFNVL